MELLKIERYSNALKVFLRPTEAYPEGQNFFYCDTDFEDYIKNAKSFNFVSSKDGFRYPVVNGTSLHRTVMNTNNKQGAVVDHISGVTWDDCRCNLRETTLRGNAINKRVLGVSYQNGYFLVNESVNGFLSRVRYENEQQALMARSFSEKALRFIYDRPIYNFLFDRRDDADLVDLVRTDRLSVDAELIEYLKRYSSNAWYYYRYIADLEPYAYLFNLNVTLNESGFLCDDFGNLLSPISGYVDETEYRLRSIEHEELMLSKKKNDLDHKKDILKRQEEQLDSDIFECAKDRVAFMNKNNLLDLSQFQRDMISRSDEAIGRIVRRRLEHGNEVVVDNDEDDFPEPLDTFSLF